MICPFCKHDDNNVLESREAEDGTSVRRRRKCGYCDKRFTTYERAEGIDMMVLKKNGRQEAFDREKIKRGLIKATWKRPVKMEQIEKIVDEVEKKLKSSGQDMVRSWEIGQLVIDRLKLVDPLGYLLFASVYRDFENLEDFSQEIASLQKQSLEGDQRHETTAR